MQSYKIVADTPNFFDVNNFTKEEKEPVVPLFLGGLGQLQRAKSKEQRAKMKVKSGKWKVQVFLGKLGSAATGCLWGDWGKQGGVEIRVVKGC